jgi:hypothetical protein
MRMSQLGQRTTGLGRMRHRADGMAQRRQSTKQITTMEGARAIARPRHLLSGSTFPYQPRWEHGVPQTRSNGVMRVAAGTGRRLLAFAGVFWRYSVGSGVSWRILAHPGVRTAESRTAQVLSVRGKVLEETAAKLAKTPTTQSLISQPCSPGRLAAGSAVQRNTSVHDPLQLQSPHRSVERASVIRKMLPTFPCWLSEGGKRPRNTVAQFPAPSPYFSR